MFSKELRIVWTFPAVAAVTLGACALTGALWPAAVGAVVLFGIFAWAS